MANNEIPFDDEETEPTPTTVVPEVVESNPLAKIKEALDPFSVKIEKMLIESPEDKDKALTMLGDLKDVTDLIKVYTEDVIDPIDKKVKRMKKAIKPFVDKIAEHVKTIRNATDVWNTKVLLEKKEADRKKTEAYEIEQKEAAKKMGEAKKEGKPTPPKVLATIAKPPPAVGKTKVKTGKITESSKLKWVWWIILADGTEWDKTEPLPLSEIPAYKGVDMPYCGVLAKLINAKFHPESGKENCGLDAWIETGERASTVIR